ncbi:hypothetical protein XELAEV_18002629mg [Xenopus laevis]|uniref:GIY-YIG domain-containing protein n=1 Tax=Xenopus laevis TaxID=8355 RepID=A0A974BQC0_XENLA|nr:hypothetical protein XELAEV_18002629mg [Xenopus laevis]
MLVHTDMRQSSECRNSKVGTFPCYNCNCCSKVQQGEVVFHPRKGYPIRIKDRYSCSSTCAIYIFKCICGLAYVGQTKRTVRERMREHKSAINTGKRDQAVAGHFIEHSHRVNQLRFQVLETVEMKQRGGNRHKDLLYREAFWIRKLETLGRRLRGDPRWPLFD